MQQKTTNNGKKFKRLSYLEIATKLAKGQATTIVFVKSDGKLVKQTVQPAFLKNAKGNKKRMSELIDDLHSIKHDMQCKFFRL